MWIVNFVHSLVEYLFSLVKLAQNRQVGWPTVDRRTGRYTREQQPLTKKLKLLLLFNPLTEWLDTTHMMRLWTHRRAIEAGKKEATAASKNQISQFVDFYGINMDEFEPSNLNAYSNFEEFFVRAHKPGSRVIHEKDNPNKAVVAADSRVVVYETVTESKKLWIKGLDFSMTTLVMDRDLGVQFTDCSVASFRLSPQDYHRFHSPVTGTIKLYRSMPGDYYDVDAIALRSNVDILTRNARDYVVIETEAFGDVLFVAIGATEVGTVR